MSHSPPFDYITQIDIALYRRANWEGFKAFHKSQMNRTAIILVSCIVIIIPLYFLVVTLEIEPLEPIVRLLSMVTFIVTILTILIFVLLARAQSRAIEKLCHEMQGKSFHTTLTEESVTIRNPNSGAVKTYPFTMLSILVDDPEFILLKAEHEVLYFGKAGLRSANALEFFESQLKPNN